MKGGNSNGHVFIAVRKAHDTYLIFNNESMPEVKTLKKLQAEHGSKVYGTMYVRSQAPVEDSWACLNTSSASRCSFTNYMLTLMHLAKHFVLSQC